MKFVGIRRVENAGQILKWKYIKSEFEFVALYICLIIDKIEDVVVGSSIPYNYEKSRF